MELKQYFSVKKTDRQLTRKFLLPKIILPSLFSLIHSLELWGLFKSTTNLEYLERIHLKSVFLQISSATPFIPISYEICLDESCLFNPKFSFFGIKFPACSTVISNLLLLLLFSTYRGYILVWKKSFVIFKNYSC